MISWDASWTNSVTNCPFEYVIEIFDSSTGLYRDLTASESAIISFASTVPWSNAYGATYAEPNAVVNVQSTDLTLDLTTW